VLDNSGRYEPYNDDDDDDEDELMVTLTSPSRGGGIIENDIQYAWEGATLIMKYV
jgi:hypothetical protein